MPELREELDRLLKQQFIKQILDIERTVKSYVDDAAASIICEAIGFTHKRWDNKWEVDHTNARKSSIANALGAKALQEVQLAIPDFIESLTGNKKLTASLRKAAIEEFEDQLHRKLKDAMFEWAKKRAAEQITRVMQDVTLPLKMEE